MVTETKKERKRRRRASDVSGLTMFLKEWDLIGSSAASEILLKMMKMRMKLVK